MNILHIFEVYQTVLFSVVLGFYFLVSCVCLLILTVLGFFMCIVVFFYELVLFMSLSSVGVPLVPWVGRSSNEMVFS